MRWNKIKTLVVNIFMCMYMYMYMYISVIAVNNISYVFAGFFVSIPLLLSSSMDSVNMWPVI